MTHIRIAKVILYPVVGVAQFALLPSVWIATILCVALCAVAALNLRRLLLEPQHDGEHISQNH